MFGESRFRLACRFFPIEAATAFHGRDHHLLRRFHDQDGPRVERPAVELPLPAPDDRERPVRRSDQDGREEKPKRGVVVIDLRRIH